MDLHKYLTNPLDDPSISMDNLMAFTTDHLTRMANNNTGGFLTTRIAATTTAKNAMDAAFQGDQTKLGERETAKQTKTAFRQALTADSGKIYAALQAKYGKTAPQLATYFPNGLTEFNRTRDDQMSNILQDLVTALTNHQADVGADVVAEATALQDGWTAVYTPSETTGGAKTTAMTGKHTARANLQRELFINLLTIGLQYPGQPEMLDIYMRPSLLGPHTPTPSTPPAPPTPPASTITLGIHDSPAQLQINLTGTAPVSWVVESSTDESHWSDLATIDGSADTWAITDTTLYYRARGVDAQGNTVIADSNDVLMSRDA